MAYVDGFILAIPKKNIKSYKKMAQLGAKVWMECGALEYIECQADDVKKGKWTSFHRSVKLKPSEVVYFSYIVYKNRKHRDAVLKKVMKHPKLQMDMKNMPFDAKRMIYGGFKQVVVKKV